MVELWLAGETPSCTRSSGTVFVVRGVILNYFLFGIIINKALKLVYYRSVIVERSSVLTIAILYIN
jgi:hypothetical protein